jgi:hypothetical protein
MPADKLVSEIPLAGIGRAPGGQAAASNPSATSEAESSPVDVAPATEPIEHPFPLHDDDQVVVEVLRAGGVIVDQRRHVQGERFVIGRGRATAANDRDPTQSVFRILRTVQYKHDPEPESRFEKTRDDIPLVIE